MQTFGALHVLLAGFLRPVVLFGPIADVAREKLAREEPDVFELASKWRIHNPPSYCDLPRVLIAFFFFYSSLYQIVNSSGQSSWEWIAKVTFVVYISLWAIEL